MTIRVLIVDDSPLIRAVLRETFAAAPDIQVVGEADDGRTAVELAAQLRPDVITMDVLMPVMDGLEATQRIMRGSPTAIVVVARDGGDVRSLAMEALARGALEVFPKPATGFDVAAAAALAATVRRVARLGRGQVNGPGPTEGSGAGADGDSARIRVLIVDDSPVVRAVLHEGLSAQPDMEVVGEAADGAQAISLAVKLRPDLITMDLLMPIMGGTDATLRIMRECPCPVLVVASASGLTESLEQEGLAVGSLEVLHKPAEGFDEACLGRMVRSIRRMVQVARARALAQPVVRRSVPVPPSEITVVGVVGSTGAPRVLRDLLAGLPSDFPVPIAVVQHTERGLASALVSWLSAATKLKVKLAVDGDSVAAGEVVVAGDDVHLELTLDGRVRLRSGDVVDGFRPSGTVLLSSLAGAFGRQALGVVLSGMGSDGADGLGAIYAAGGTAVVEDPESAVVAGMPERALVRATGAFVEKGERLAWLITELVAGGSGPHG
jgi:two-component system, chemotaxis family, protein-glutamate methylesterase/glutaminase